MAEKNIKMKVAYDGTCYHGWQRQENGLTIQQVIEEKISIMTCGQIRVNASGRTDAGVHALGQVFSFRTDSSLEPSVMRKGLNSMLPGDILIKEAVYAELDFHARYSARSKRYEYCILNRIEPDIFTRNYRWHIRRPLMKEEMSACLRELEGTHDFSSFRSAGSENDNPVRTISRAELIDSGTGELRIITDADGFLRHMVRNIVGTLVEVGTGKLSPEDFMDILEARDRSAAGPKAPARGLFLVEVRY